MAEVTRDELSSVLALHLRHQVRRNLRPRTIASRQDILQRFERALDGRDLLEATHEDLQQHLDRPALGMGSLAVEMSHLKSFYRWAVLEGLVVTDPTVRLVRPKVRRRLPRPIPTVDLVRALDEAPPRIRPWLYLAAYAGLRACEIAALRREDVLDRADPPVLVVADGKGGGQRVVPMPAELVAELRTWPMPDVGWLFTKQNALGECQGQPCPAHLVSAHCNRYLHRIGIAGTLHTLRHWYGTTVYSRSKDLRLTQELMGHASPVTTAGYAQWAPHTAAGVVDGINAGATPADEPPRWPAEFMTGWRYSCEQIALYAGMVEGERDDHVAQWVDAFLTTFRCPRRDIVEAHRIARRSMMTGSPLPRWDEGAQTYDDGEPVVHSADVAVDVLATVLNLM